MAGGLFSPLWRVRAIGFRPAPRTHPDKAFNTGGEKKEPPSIENGSCLCGMTDHARLLSQRQRFNAYASSIVSTAILPLR